MIGLLEDMTGRLMLYPLKSWKRLQRGYQKQTANWRTDNTMAKDR